MLVAIGVLAVAGCGGGEDPIDVADLHKDVIEEAADAADTGRQRLGRRHRSPIEQNAR
jgi:hypothetical protein